MATAARVTDTRHADRLLLVIGAVTGACVALERLASDEGTAGSTWLMVLIRGVVAAQGGAALLWVLRGALRWLVGRVSGSHAVRNAYMRDDTTTYAVLLLTLATAVGVQLVAPVVWLILALFVAAQALVWHRAQPARARRDGAWQERRNALGAFLIGCAALLLENAWRRALQHHVGQGATTSTMVDVAFLLSVAAGVWASTAWGAPAVARGAARRGVLAVVLALLAVYALVAPLFVAGVGRWVAAKPMVVILVGVLEVVGLPAALVGLVLAMLAARAAAAPDARQAGPARVVGWVLLGAAAGSVALVDLILPFTGLRGTGQVAAVLLALSAMLAAVREAAPLETPSMESVR